MDALALREGPGGGTEKEKVDEEACDAGAVLRKESDRRQGVLATSRLSIKSCPSRGHAALARRSSQPQSKDTSALTGTRLIICLAFVHEQLPALPFSRLILPS